ncbi:hypothetical protein BH10PLA2_BH10PLA2_10320 [soil metagenome]
MSISDFMLYRLARRWPSPMARMTNRLKAEVGTSEYNRAYAQDQFDHKVREGLRISVSDLDVLEIGCGHGGISCFLAVVGARRVVGIDLNTAHLKIAAAFAQTVASRFQGASGLPVEFVEMNAVQMSFPDGIFDVVVADNSFEHFTDPIKVIQESFRVLRPGGRLLVPVFSSIYSKYGLHLKHGLKLPWANLVFSEKTIIRAMERLAKDEPRINDLYPGLTKNPKRVRDLRPYKDLNDITYRAFKQMARETGFEIEWFYPHSTRVGKIVSRIPLVNKTRLNDIFSKGAAACLRRPRA